MDLRQLRYFVQVASVENFREAASLLNVSQSSLSRRVSDLEQSLGVQLFERHPRGVTLTEAGRVLLARAETLLGEFEAVRAEIAQLPESLTEIVTIGSSRTVGRRLLAPLAEEFRLQYPELKLHFVQAKQHSLVEGMTGGRIDLAVMTAPEPIAGCTSEPLLTEQLYFVSLKSDRPEPKSMRVEDLRGVPLVFFAQTSTRRNYVDQIAQEHGVKLDVRYEVTDTVVQLEFVRHRIACGLLPFSVIADDPRRHELLVCPVADFALPRALVWRNDRARLPAVASVANAIKTLMRTIATEETDSPFRLSGTAGP